MSSRIIKQSLTDTVRRAARNILACYERVVFEELKSGTSFDHAKIEDQRGPSSEAAARAELMFSR
jgi:hypothetical protein